MIDKWYNINCFRVVQGNRILNYCYLDNEICYIYKGEEKKIWNIKPPKRWGKIFNKYNIKYFYREMQNG